MASDAVTGLGATIVWKTKTIAEGVNLRGPKVNPPGKVKCTHFGSVKYHDYVTGLCELGTLHFEANLIDDDALWAVINDDGSSGTYTVTYASGWGFTGTGVIGYEPSSDPENPEKISIDIEMDSTPTPTSPS